MGIPRALSLTALGVTLLLGCGPAADSETEAPGETEVVSEDVQELSCFLRGEPEEIAQRESPLGEVAVEFEGGETAKLCYGRPSMNGRVILGELVPFGEPWRLGANEATAIHLPFAANVGGIELEPGSYSIYAIPGELEWEFVVNGNAERWGIPISDDVRSADIGSFTSLARQLTEPVEQLTVRWHTHGGDAGHLMVDWETTRVEFEVTLSGGAEVRQ